VTTSSPPRSRVLARAVALLGALSLTAVAAASSAFAAPTAPSFPSGIDPYTAYEGQTTCDPTEKPGARALREMVTRAYPGTGSTGGITRSCDGGGVSEHKEGRAWDWMLDASDPSDRAAADDLFAWLLATDVHGNKHALLRRLGIMYIIWNGQVLKAYQADKGWQPYTGANPHTDHVHFTLGWDGARQLTSYWPPTPEDLHTVMVSGTGSGRVEVHSLSAASRYQQFNRHVATAFGTITDPRSWRFLLGGGTKGAPDLIGVRLRGGASGKVEVHVATGSSGYQAFSVHQATPLAAVDPAQWQVAAASSPGSGAPDLQMVWTRGGASGRVELHTLTGSSAYSRWSVHAATALGQAADGQWHFTGDPGGSGDLVGVLRSGTGSGRTEVHVLSAASGYTGFRSHAATPLGLMDPATTTFAVGHFDKDRTPDLWAIVLSGTGTGRTELHPMSGATGYSTWLDHLGTGLQQVDHLNWALDPAA
jgi:hypothetical protein